MTSWLRMLIVAGLAIGIVLTGLAWLGRFLPRFDVFNNGIPLIAAGALGLFVLALAARNMRLILATGALAAINAAFFLAGLQGAAADAEPGAERFLRVVTLNVRHGNDRIDNAIAFLDRTDADVVVLQEMARPHTEAMRRALGQRYPYAAGEFGVVILSKFPIKAEGRLDRAGYPEWMSPFARWIEIDVKGTPVELVGAHFARPFYTDLQQVDATTLAQFVKTRSLPLIVAGDFNLTPWAERLKAFMQATGLERYNTLHPTWPMRWRKYPFLPLFPIDHVFASDRFAKIATVGGPRIGSDHRPVIADIALQKE